MKFVKVFLLVIVAALSSVMAFAQPIDPVAWNSSITLPPLF